MLAPSSQPSASVSAVLAIPVLLLLVLLQSSLFSYLQIGGVTVQVAVLVTIAVALWRSSAEAVTWAFIAGILIDLNSIGPLGGSAFALILAVLVITPFRVTLAYNRVLLPLLLAGACTLVFLLASLIIFRIAGTPPLDDYSSQIPARVIVHALIIVPLYWMLRATNIFSRQPEQINL